MAEISIPDDELRDLLSTQILAALSEETRTKLIEAALKFLVVSNPDVYSRKTTPMQEAFNAALHRLANKVAEEIIAEHGVGDRLREQMTQLLAEVPDLSYDWELQTAIFRAIITHAEKAKK